MLLDTYNITNDSGQIGISGCIQASETTENKLEIEKTPTSHREEKG